MGKVVFAFSGAEGGIDGSPANLKLPPTRLLT